MTIPVLNIYYLLCYAWDSLEYAEMAHVDSDDFDSIECRAPCSLWLGASHACRVVCGCAISLSLTVLHSKLPLHIIKYAGRLLFFFFYIVRIRPLHDRVSTPASFHATKYIHI